MRPRPPIFRKLADAIVKLVACLASLIGIFFLGWILFEVAKRGAMAINWEFFTELPSPPGVENGGVSSAIVGTVAMALGESQIHQPVDDAGRRRAWEERLRRQIAHRAALGVTLGRHQGEELGEGQWRALLGHPAQLQKRRSEEQSFQ